MLMGSAILAMTRPKSVTFRKRAKLAFPNWGPNRMSQETFNYRKLDKPAGLRPLMLVAFSEKCHYFFNFLKINLTSIFNLLENRRERC